VPRTKRQRSYTGSSTSPITSSGTTPTTREECGFGDGTVSQRYWLQGSSGLPSRKRIWWCTFSSKIGIWYKWLVLTVWQYLYWYS